MARPRKVSDDQILEAAARVVARVGPFRATLAEIAAAVEVTPAALIQRFGSRRGLLLALAQGGAEDVAQRFASAQGSGAALEALHATLAALVEPLATRTHVANGLAFLQMDLQDDAFHEAARAWFDGFREGVRALLDEARAEDALRTEDTATLARAVEVAYHGSLLAWAMRGGETAPEALRRDVDAVLSPHLTPGRSGASRGSRAGAAPGRGRGRGRAP